jgi:hypothetical protein
VLNRSAVVAELPEPVAAWLDAIGASLGVHMRIAGDLAVLTGAGCARARRAGASGPRTINQPSRSRVTALDRSESATRNIWAKGSQTSVR